MLLAGFVIKAFIQQQAFFYDAINDVLIGLNWDR